MKESGPFILAIDAGNTRIKWGLHDGRAWMATGARMTAGAEHLADDLPAEVAGTRAIASNVAGAEVGNILERVCKQRGVTVRFIATAAQQLGVRNGYRVPQQLGTDRWAALVAAHRSGPGDKLVINVGTALTIDVLGADGQFRGGVIVPGPEMMRRSLNKGTAGLQATEGRFDPLPASTPDAITSGAIQACLGAIERMAASARASGAGNPRWYVSGGGLRDLAPHLPGDAIIDENRVLDGLVLIARDS